MGRRSLPFQDLAIEILLEPLEEGRDDCGAFLVKATAERGRIARQVVSHFRRRRLQLQVSRYLREGSIQKPLNRRPKGYSEERPEVERRC